MKQCECCGGGLSRQGAGPTSRKKQWMIPVDYCSRCGCHYPLDSSKLNYEQLDWIDRWNRRCREQYDESPPEEESKYCWYFEEGSTMPNIRSVDDTSAY